MQQEGFGLDFSKFVKTFVLKIKMLEEIQGFRVVVGFFNDYRSVQKLSVPLGIGSPEEELCNPF